MYVLRRFEDDKFVKRFGSEKSYTDKLQEAQTFKTIYDAEAHRCGNEQIVSVESIMWKG